MWGCIWGTAGICTVGCRVNSLRRGDEDFREDLAEALKVVGSVFREISGSGKLEEKSDVP